MEMENLAIRIESFLARRIPSIPLRDHLACQAMVAIINGLMRDGISRPEHFDDGDINPTVALAYDIADAMLKERNKKGGDE